MCTKMLILWTILVLGSLLQGAYAENPKTESQQSNTFNITTTTTIITTSVTSESRATTPAPTSQAAETASPNRNDTSKDPTSSPQQPHYSTALATDSVNNGLKISTVSVTPMTLNLATTVSATQSSFTTVSATQSSSTIASATQSSSTIASATQSSSAIASATQSSSTIASATQSSSAIASATQSSSAIASATQSSSTIASGTQSSSTIASGTQSSSTIASGTQSSSTIASGTQSSNTTVPVTPNSTTTIEVIHNSATTVPVPHNYTTMVLGIHTTNGNTSENTDGSNAAPVDQETTATTSHKISTTNSAKGSQHVNEEGTTQPSTSTISHAKIQVSLTNDLQPKTFNRTVAANRNGDTFERMCTLLIDTLNVTGNCNMAGREINGVYEYKIIQLIVGDSSKDTSKETQSEDVPKTSIAILASCGALALILIGFAVYCSYHRLSYRKNQQHLTEELQTVENGYHDNPTLEVMEAQPEMQEKKLALNGEFNDSWIVPFDNIAKDDIPDEEDTHL